MNYQNKTSDYWRNYLINGVNSKDKQIATKTSNFIVDNLLRYYKENLTLSYEGYIELENNWEEIRKNTQTSYYHLIIARRYLRKEKHRLESLVWTEPKYHKPNKSIFTRFKLMWGFT